ncbi:hypothetical protein M0813_21062 [Anaeramoeba flamelloides]|uniref:C2H2-type domain-containing protein n=1 Tax=Anaeramoeba flamelloides TaxID=1746091 RepID=A0ABQ8YIQ1_9EUKA|nr:hypothetical protein M0813_21062 [Anaeramoeba flamelloides]
MDLQNLTICIDAGWSSRRNANECCFIVIDQKTQLLFDLIVVTREIYSGASGNMEAEAAKFFCEKHKKKLIWLVLLKMATPTKRERKNWKHVINEINDKYNYFFEKKINLYNNNINFYQESEIEDESLFKLSPQLIELSNLIDEISDRSEEFFTAGSTNKNESFMNSRTKFIEKRINAAKQWEMRYQFSALNRELPEWKTILMDTLGFKINLPQIISQYNKNLEKQYEKYRQNTDEYKKQRLIRKVKKIANKKRRKEEGRYLFKDDEDDENLKKNRKFSCRYECTTLYKTKLSRLIHEIIFHQRVPVSREKI